MTENKEKKGLIAKVGENKNASECTRCKQVGKSILRGLAYVGFTRNLYFVFCILLLKPSNEASLKNNDVGEVNYEQG